MSREIDVGDGDIRAGALQSPDLHSSCRSEQSCTEICVCDTCIASICTVCDKRDLFCRGDEEKEHPESTLFCRLHALLLDKTFVNNVI